MIAVSFASNAQGRLQFSDIYLLGNGGATFTGPLQNSEINSLEKNLVNSSVIAPLENKNQVYYGSGNRYYGNFGMMAGWNIRGARYGNQKLRLGFTSGLYQLNWNNYYSNKETYRIDTLVSQTTGKEIYIDSTHHKSLNYEHRAQMFNLHADYLLYFNPRDKFSFYTGIGASIGFSLSNTVTASYYEHGENDYEKSFYDYDKSWEKEDKNNSYSNSKRLSPALNYNLRSLVGLNYRISKRHRFFKRMNLFGEMLMGLEVNTMENINPSIGFNLGGQGGLRVALNNPAKKSFRKKVIQKRKRRRY